VQATQQEVAHHRRSAQADFYQVEPERLTRPGFRRLACTTSSATSTVTLTLSNGCSPGSATPIRAQRPTLLRHNIACLDWSVAKGGFLGAYRWGGESAIDAAKFVRTG
jgi:hypothetical protein